MDGYNEQSCSVLEKPFYRPIEVALRWCGLIDHEVQILGQIDADGMLKPEKFPQWPCLRLNTEKIFDAIDHGEIPHGRDGKVVEVGAHVAPSRRTVRHSDLRIWMAEYYPDQKPAFLFDVIERTTHTKLNAEAFQVLKADLDVARLELQRANEQEANSTLKMGEMRSELDSLKQKAEKGLLVIERNTLLVIIAALCDEAGIKHADRGAATGIAQLTERLGVSVSDDTVRRWLKQIPEALESRMK